VYRRRRRNVIQDPDVYQTQSIAQPCHDELVGLRWFGDTARVRVGEDHRGGVLPLQLERMRRG